MEKQEIKITLFDKEIKINSDLIFFSELRKAIYKICETESLKLEQQFLLIAKKSSLNDNEMVNKFKNIAYGYWNTYEDIFLKVYELLLNEYNYEGIAVEEFKNRLEYINTMINAELMKIINDNQIIGRDSSNRIAEESAKGMARYAALSNYGSPVLAGLSTQYTAMQIDQQVNNYIYNVNYNFIKTYSQVTAKFIEMTEESSLLIAMNTYEVLYPSKISKLTERGLNIENAKEEFEKYSLLKDKDKQIEKLISAFELNKFDPNILAECLKRNTSSNKELIDWIFISKPRNEINFYATPFSVSKKFKDNIDKLEDYFYKDSFEKIESNYEKKEIFNYFMNCINDYICKELNIIADFENKADTIESAKKKVFEKGDLLEKLFDKTMVENYKEYQGMNIYEYIKQMEKNREQYIKNTKFISRMAKIFFGIMLFIFIKALKTSGDEFGIIHIFIILLTILYIYKLFTKKIWFTNSLE